MFEIINIFEIFFDYLSDMNKDLKLIPLIFILFLIPFLWTWMLSYLVVNVENFAQLMIIVSSIFIPLLFQVLIIVHYSIERTRKKDVKSIIELKLEFLKHMNTTTSMVIFISITVLFLSILLKNVDDTFIFKNFNLYSILKYSLMFLVGFMFENIIIVLLRIYRLINFEIKEYKGGDHDPQ